MSDTEENPEISEENVLSDEDQKDDKQDIEDTDIQPAEEVEECEEDIEDAEDIKETEEDTCKIRTGEGPKLNDEEKLMTRFLDDVEASSKRMMEATSTCGPKDTSDSPEECSEPTKRWSKPLKGEMHYYLSTLRLAVPNMTRSEDKIKLRKWIFYLLRRVDDKILRNRYLLLATLSALCDECMGLMREEAPSPEERCLPAFSSCRIPPARWEADVYWDRLVADLQDVECAWAKCSLHKSCSPNGGLEEGVIEAVGGVLMDQEFKYLLYLIRPIVAKITCPREKTRVSMWIQRLGTIRPNSCVFMKGLRNDYMQALLGYISVGRSPGPFKSLPPDTPLVPLDMEAKKFNKAPMLSELSRDVAEEFLSSQTPLNNGAICYVAISGNPNDTRIKFSPLDVDFEGMI